MLNITQIKMCLFISIIIIIVIRKLEINKRRDVGEVGRMNRKLMEEKDGQMDGQAGVMKAAGVKVLSVVGEKGSWF